MFSFTTTHVLPLLTAALAVVILGTVRGEAQDPTPPVTLAEVFEMGQVPGWIESLDSRRTGDLMLTIASSDTEPPTHLYYIDIRARTIFPTALVTFPGFLAATGITEVETDVFAVATGNFSTADFNLGEGTWAIHRVRVSVIDDFGDDKPKPASGETELVGYIPEAGFIIGIEAFDPTTIFVADAALGVLYLMDLDSGAYAVVLADPDTMMAPADAPISEGIHGLVYLADEAMLYFANTFGNAIYRLPVDPLTGSAAGEVELITDKLETPEGFAADGMGNLYVPSLNEAGVFKVNVESGAVEKIADVEEALACVIGRGVMDRFILVVTAGGNFLEIEVEGLSSNSLMR